MARLLLLVLTIVTIYALWRAFGPKPATPPERPAVKGPDDDEDFLWNLEKEAFKKRREAERKKKDE